MQDARVAIFEDHYNLNNILALAIEDCGHLVVASVLSMEDARSTIGDLEKGALDVAIVDGNLTPGVDSGSDGAEITSLLHDKIGTVTVIGFSGSEGSIEGVDRTVPKEVDDPVGEILTIIRQL